VHYRSTHRVGWAGTLGSERLTVREHRNRLAHDAQGRRGELFVRGVFDLGVRRKPQAFAADAVDLWILSPNLLIINELELYDAMPGWRTYSAPATSAWLNSASAAPAASFSPANLSPSQISARFDRFSGRTFVEGKFRQSRQSSTTGQVGLKTCLGLCASILDSLDLAPSGAPDRCFRFS
jgi:hypothetical protein